MAPHIEKAMTEEGEYAKARERMVHQQLELRNIRDSRVLDAMRKIPRHQFVPKDSRSHAYADAPLPIGESQTISQPYIVALMTQLLELEPTDTVLEVGTGSGYQAAILAELTRLVYSLERLGPLADRAHDVLHRLGYENVVVIQRDGSLGLPEHAPYDAIIVTAAAPKAPQALKDQLGDGGRMVVPVGGRSGQILERWTRQGQHVNVEEMVPVAFVPLVGDQGWEEPPEKPRRRWFGRW
jgi:protein-L-isoaspartate(D-aspartate) O-methyltransferase